MCKPIINNIQRLEQLVGPVQSSDWLIEVEKRAVNRSKRNYSQKIVIRILRELRARNLSKRDFAIILGITPQTVNKWMKGDVNFTLETIEKIEDALDVDLIEVLIERSPVKLINNAVSEEENIKIEL